MSSLAQDKFCLYFPDKIFCIISIRMSYPYWPNGSIVGYQQLAFNSNTNVLTLQPGGNAVSLTTSGGGGTTIITSTITVNQTTSEPPGLEVSSANGPASIVVNALTGASITVIGSEATIQVQGSQNGSLFVQTSLVGVDANPNLFEVANDNASIGTHSNIMASMTGNENYGAAINLRYISAGTISHQGRFEVYSNETAVSSMVLGLYDSVNNPLAELGFSSNGLATNDISARQFIAQNGGPKFGSVYYPGFTNEANPLDILQAIPLARVLNATGGDADASSGLNQFGRHTPGANFGSIPPTSYTNAATIVLAPRTFFNMFTGSSGSGGSAQYNNETNELFSTFTVQPFQNGNTFNSYVLGFGN